MYGELMQLLSRAVERPQPEVKTAQPSDDNPEPAKPSRRPTIGKAADTILILKKSLYEMGKERALAAMDTRQNEEVLRSIEAHAEAMAREQAATLFNPDESIHDRLRQQEYETAWTAIPKLEADLAVVADDVRKRRDALAETGEPPAYPQTPWLLFLFGALLIGGTVAPTLHDFFFDLSDPRLGWVLSVASGSVAGLLLSWSLVGTAAATSKTSRWVGLVSGVSFSLSLVLIRMIGGNSRSATILAVGLGLLEIAVVLLLDWIGSGLRNQHVECEKHLIEHARRSRVLNAAEDEFEYRKGLLGEQKSVVAEHLSDVADRESRVRQLDDLIRGAVQAVHDGYHAGLAELEGRLHGRDN